MVGIDWLKSGARALLPPSAQRWVRRLTMWPPVGMVQFGSLRKLTPVGRRSGRDRGQPIDRYYIENFLARHGEDIRGRVMEIAEDTYTRRFGGDRVARADILDVSAENHRATIVADLTQGEHIPGEIFDCIVFTQTLQCIYDVRAALATLQRVLKPGGVLLATTHGIGQTYRRDMERWGEWWRLTRLSARRLFEEFFPPDLVEVCGYGNVLAATALMHGLATSELTREELDYHDPSYELLITIRAVKPQDGALRTGGGVGHSNGHSRADEGDRESR